MKRRSTLLASLLFAAPLIAQVEPVEPVEAEPVFVGEGHHRYEWIRGWGRLPGGKDLGNTHGCMVVDAKGLIYANTDTARAVCVFDSEGKLVRSWGAKLRGGLHGMTIRKEGNIEFLYLSHIGRSEVFKATLDGKVIWTLGYPKESGIYKKAAEFRPTGVAVAPNGHIFVADGYGKSWVHEYDASRKYLRSFGGRGTKPGKMRTPHGLWIDTRGKTPKLIVCDRENHRLQVFGLDGKLDSVVEGMLRRPCNVYQHGSELVVADLAGRITILDRNNKLVCHIGDNPDPKQRAKNGVPKQDWRAGVFLSPHSACFDAEGNLYVMDWNRWGRLTKLARIRSDR